MTDLFAGFWSGRRVLVTGHTGFKGSWLTLWLRRLGAEVTGVSLPSPTEPSHWKLLELDIPEVIGDLNDRAVATSAVARSRPEIVFHLAAQSLVRESYRAPLTTFQTNLIAALQLFEACRAAGGVRAVVCITTDKVYENREWEWPYREDDALGGWDPYSASKACLELAAASYRRSFWSPANHEVGGSTLLATARAGNVIGGGDWAADRLVPDLMRAAALGVETTIRNPDATRPWQHVLEPLFGYLLLGRRLFLGEQASANAWNLGPAEEDAAPVRRVVAQLGRAWPAVRATYRADPNAPHEATSLRLDSARARRHLGWRPVWDLDTAVTRTARWYETWYRARELTTSEDLDQFTADARRLGLALADGHTGTDRGPERS